MRLEKISIRNTSIELLKIIAIILIILSHVVQTLGETNDLYTTSEYVVDFAHASDNFQDLVLALMRYGGALVMTFFSYVPHGFLLTIAV